MSCMSLGQSDHASKFLATANRKYFNLDAHKTATLKIFLVCIRWIQNASGYVSNLQNC